jgi:hypothetical protein
MSKYGVRIALPEMMALADLLHHPSIGEAQMGQLFSGRKIKRANKDLGRVVALAFLADQQDENVLETWGTRWQFALNEMAPDQAAHLLTRAPSGLHALLGVAAGTNTQRFGRCGNADGVLASGPEVASDSSVNPRVLQTSTSP